MHAVERTVEGRAGFTSRIVRSISDLTSEFVKCDNKLQQIQ